MSLLIKPSFLNGQITIPPSKSLSHRAIICASLAEGKSKISNIIFSDDIRATIEGMKVLGSKIKKENNYIIAEKNNTTSNNITKNSTICCNESGTTLRFLIPLSLVIGNGATFEGKNRLISRPLDIYYNIFKKQNIFYETNKGGLPLTVKGELLSRIYEIPGNISSQFISGLLLALPLLKGNSEIKVTGTLQSKNYLDLTLDILKRYNIEIEKYNDCNYFIRGNQCYKHCNYTVEGDFSQAAFFLSANAIGNNINCLGLNLNSLQGDREILNIIKEYSAEKKQIRIDASHIPDLVPAISVIASLKENCTTNIINAQRLRLKESDRLKAIRSQMNKIGANISETKDGLIIKGKKSLYGNATVSSCNDHRIAMALSIAASKCENPIVLEGYSAVNKSYPGFWEDYQSLGGEIIELDNRQ